MKTLMFSAMGVAALLLVGWQHQQLGRLRGENSSLAQSSAEAERLKADLAKSAGDEAQNEEEIERLRVENRDLLKLRNEVVQLRETRAEFQRVSAENLRLQAQAKNALKPEANYKLPQPIAININALYDSGLNTPEAACQTFFWAIRENNKDGLRRCLAPESRSLVEAYSQADGFKDVISIEIVARRELDADTVQLGITIRMRDASHPPMTQVVKLSRKDGEWRLDLKNPM